MRKIDIRQLSGSSKRPREFEERTQAEKPGEAAQKGVKSAGIDFGRVLEPPRGIVLAGAPGTKCEVGSGVGIFLSPKAFEQLVMYTSLCDTEISLLGVVERKGSLFSIQEFLLFGQSGSGASTKIDPAALADFISQAAKSGRISDIGKIRCWVHTHPGMGAFWSRTDEDTCRLLSTDWFVSIVVGDGFSVRCRIDIAVPIPIKIDNVPIYREFSVSPDVVEKYRKEIDEKVEARSFLLPTTKYGDHRGYSRDTDVLEYCDMCGNWHSSSECPFLIESGYEGLFDGGNTQSLIEEID